MTDAAREREQGDPSKCRCGRTEFFPKDCPCQKADAAPLSGVELIREVLAFSSFKGAPGTAAEEALDALIAERDAARAEVERLKDRCERWH